MLHAQRLTHTHKALAQGKRYASNHTAARQPRPASAAPRSLAACRWFPERPPRLPRGVRPWDAPPLPPSEAPPPPAASDPPRSKRHAASASVSGAAANGVQ